MSCAEKIYIIHIYKTTHIYIYLYIHIHSYSRQRIYYWIVTYLSHVTRELMCSFTKGPGYNTISLTIVPC